MFILIDFNAVLGNITTSESFTLLSIFIFGLTISTVYLLLFNKIFKLFIFYLKQIVSTFHLQFLSSYIYLSILFLAIISTGFSTAS